MAVMSLTYSAVDFLIIAAALYLVLSAVLVGVQAALEYWLSRRFRIAEKQPKLIRASLNPRTIPKNDGI
jgi:hypothetical protein